MRHKKINTEISNIKKSAFTEILELQNLEIFLQRAFKLSDEKLIAEQEKHKAEQEFVRLAAQAAHDIISPVTALNLALEQIPNMTHEQHHVVHQIETSICNIASELMQKYLAIKSKRQSEVYIENNLAPYSIANIIDKVYQQKILELKKTDIKLTKYIEEGVENFFSLINPIYLERILSNIINNSRDAIKIANRLSDGKIYIALERQGKNMAITVSDNGCGIPDDILKKLGKEEFITNKKEGHGVGLYAAAQIIKSWNGSYHIDRKRDGGTQFVIYLPVCE